MTLLLDTHILIWLALSGQPDARTAPDAVKNLVNDPDNRLFFSAASIWELAIKLGKREGFAHNPARLREGLLTNRYEELAITGAHVLAAGPLPPIHADPFDRIMIAQAMVENMLFVTADRQIARYDAPIRLV
ncbi:type II toxin-antitoxin system VapC family toxin [soil metagenome]